MSVTVMSRSKAISYCHKPHGNPAVMISISDPYMSYTSMPFRSRENNIKDILRLCFADADTPGMAVAGTGEDAHQYMASWSDLMSDEDGAEIKEFVEQYRDIDIIVHCDAGISRSSGVAAAILKYLTGDDSAIFDDPRYSPNMLCYRKTLSALME